ncbi:cytochrome d ubiquinol oxidase subunit II [Lactobacillus sp. CC-MHH1034]|uniref:cytochrome d ubiquinol oxidase subunit II n=1 Tax=Agrilactobacillus fermenti TaxID=2586909 RepID=UPI001E5D9713|nr:cytochrome d ubiquinol oxidase subunit II [Agrilactobacillus fermenti]MCD2257435.1 cytochrome d ubiquinol oxidase subunit II [Agrilactobacillus fermenti]
MLELTNLQVILLAVIAIELVLFFVLNGADFGAGVATLFANNDAQQRNAIVKVSGPVWGGNEAWLVVALATMFAAFPGWYSALASGYYLVFLLVLFFFIFRGVAFDYRNQWHAKAMNRFWDWGLFFGSLVPPFLIGLVFTSSFSGIPIKNGFVYANFFDIVTPFSLVGGLMAVILSLDIGLARVIKKVPVNLATKLMHYARITNFLVYPFFLLVLILLPMKTHFFANHPAAVTFLLLLTAVATIVQTWAMHHFHAKTAFWLAVVMMGSFILSLFIGVFPNLIVGVNPATTINAISAASGRESQLWVAWLLGFSAPIMIIVQAYAYHLINHYYNTPASAMDY